MSLKALITATAPNIFVIKNRAAFKAVFGVDAPDWDSSQPVKNWVDRRVNLDPETELDYVGVKYDSNDAPLIDGDRVVKLAHFKMLPDIAVSPNLLPDPLPVLTPLQQRMSKRQQPLPLELKPGERVVLAPGIGMIPVIDDGVAAAPGTVVAFTQADRDTLNRIATKVGA